MLDKVCVKGGLKVHPGKTTLIAFLSGEDVSNDMVLVEEPMGLKDVENIENRKLSHQRQPALCALEWEGQWRVSRDEKEQEVKEEPVLPIWMGERQGKGVE